MLAKLGGYEVDVSPVKFTDGETDAQDYMAMTFRESNEALNGKTLIIGGFKEVDDSFAYEAFFDGEPESGALVKEHEETINMIVLDIIQAHIDNAAKDTNDSN